MCNRFFLKRANTIHADIRRIIISNNYKCTKWSFYSRLKFKQLLKRTGRIQYKPLSQTEQKEGKTQNLLLHKKNIIYYSHIKWEKNYKPLTILEGALNWTTNGPNRELPRRSIFSKHIYSSKLINLHIL
jgi:hypothetical protein